MKIIPRTMKRAGVPKRGQHITLHSYKPVEPPKPAAKPAPQDEPTPAAPAPKLDAITRPKTTIMTKE